jgi:tetratricopeptide (TPR) repeat protein
VSKKKAAGLFLFSFLSVVLCVGCIKGKAEKSAVSTNIDSKIVANGHYSRARELKESGDIEGAISEYSQAIEYNSDMGEAYANRGILYYSKKEFEKAISDFSVAIVLDPKDAISYNNRGLAYVEVGQFDRAILDYKKGLEIEPEDADIYYNLAVAYLHKKDYELSMQSITKAETLGYYDSTGLHEWLEKIMPKGKDK